MPLINTPFQPGHCLENIKQMEDGPRKEIALAEYHYFSGQPEKAIQEAEPYLNCPNGAYRLSACWIYAYANLSVGQIQHTQYALTEIQNTLAANAEKKPTIRAIQAFVVFASSTSRRNAPHTGISAVTATWSAGICSVRPGPLSLSERGLRKKRGYRSVHHGYGRRSIPYPCDLLTFGCSYGLYEFETDTTGRTSSAGRMANRTPRRSHRRFW